MKDKMNFKWVIIIAGLLLFAFFGNANALPDYSLDYGDSYYLGAISPNNPANPTSEASYINALNDLAAGATLTGGFGGQDYSRVGSIIGEPPFPDAVWVDGYPKDDAGNDSLDLGDSVFLYIIAKYDAGNAGSMVWFNPLGFTGDILVPDLFPNELLSGEDADKYGVSHIAAFTGTPVPEPGTMLLIGSGLLSLAALRRKMFNK